ncbi:MAG: hypothetical protein K9G76_02360 [Bacteroidales bacterium]|nr:hypothetical protein [Bacteroidales bacterium]MCF8404893.1 hypothetical protein [Bacteroidales bacterium]
MNTSLNSGGYIPLSQPFSWAPWNYSGTEEVISIPGINVVDWVLIELRDAPEISQAIPSSQIARRACFVLSNGQVMGIDGSTDLSFPLVINDSLYAVIYHRGHLGIISSKGLQELGGIFDYDFTASANKVNGGSLGYKEIAPGTWGMAGGDANGDGQIDILDKSTKWESNAGYSGYISDDFTMDSQSNNVDKNDIWLPNSGMGSQVSENTSFKFKSGIPK